MDLEKKLNVGVIVGGVVGGVFGVLVIVVIVFGIWWKWKRDWVK